MTRILGIGQTALNAAQIGLTTTSHNIANANTEGYSRQIIVQETTMPERSSFGFLGKGTEVTGVRRIYNEFITTQVHTAQTSQNGLAAYHSQIKQINNMFADSTVGISPALQDFFKGVQALASDPASGAARQSMLSAAQTLAGQFRDVNARLDQIRDGVNGSIKDNIKSINSYATEIAKLNHAISKVEAGNNGKPANDLLDQRDRLVSELSKEIKVTVVPQEREYNIFIGNGQSLVVGAKSFNLVPVTSQTDPSKIQVGYQSNSATITIADSAFSGGKLGGALEFRSQALDQVQNSLGHIAIGLGSAFNSQHQLGQDTNGALGGNFFNVGSPQVNSSTTNIGNAKAAATITDANALTTSDYRFEYGGPNDYRVTRISDGATTTSASIPFTVDGVDFDIESGTPQPGNIFLVKPTAAGAASFSVAFNDPAKIAAAAPIRTTAASTNTGTGKISAGTVGAAYSVATVTPAVNLSFNANTNELSGFPNMPVTVTSNGNSTEYNPGDTVPYTEGAIISFGGVSFSISGTPHHNDQYMIGPNTNGVGDNRNALLLGSLQSAKTLGNGTINFQTAFGQMVNMVGNKMHEVAVNKATEDALLSRALDAQQSESGVNLDEEAANLLRYQQAYQAAGKVMQTASKLFDVLLSLGL